MAERNNVLNHDILRNCFSNVRNISPFSRSLDVCRCGNTKITQSEHMQQITKGTISEMHSTKNINSALIRRVTLISEGFNSKIITIKRL